MSNAPASRPDPQAHKRYLEYRDRHSYFGKAEKILTLEEFVPREKELAALEER